MNHTLIQIKNRLVPRPLQFYIDLFDGAAEVIRSSPTNPRSKLGALKYSHPKITIDGSPTYIYDFDGWTKLAANKGLSEPKYTIADLIHEVTPQAKVIFILRNPTDR